MLTPSTSTFKDLIDDVYIALTPEFQIADYNRQAEAVFGWQSEQTIQDHFFTRLQQDNIEPPLDQQALSALSESQAVRKTQKLSHPDKGTISLNWKIEYIQEQEQAFICLIGRNVTSMEEDEVYFQGARSTLRQIIDSVPGVMYWKDRDGCYLGCNKDFLIATGLQSEDEVIGLTDKDLCWGEGFSKYYGDDVNVIENGEPLYDVDDIAITADGKTIRYLSNKVPLFDKSGNSYAVLGVSTDITKRKKAEESLRLAKEEIEMVSKAKNEFILNLSHDLLVPLYEILGMQDMALMAVEEAKLMLQSSSVSLTDLQSALSILISHIEESQTAARTSTDRLMELYHSSSGYLMGS